MVCLRKDFFSLPITLSYYADRGDLVHPPDKGRYPSVKQRGHVFRYTVFLTPIKITRKAFIEEVENERSKV